MNIIGILGSSRNGGNTEILLDLALEEAKNDRARVSKIPLRGKTLASCDGCRRCSKTGKCVIRGFMLTRYTLRTFLPEIEIEMRHGG